MKPSQLASQLRRIASAIDNSKNPDRTLVARDLKKILSAVTADQAFIHMNIDLNEHPDLDPDGSSSVAFQNAVESIGGLIENWEGEWLDIKVPRSELKTVLSGLEAIEAGQHGPDAQKIAQAYAVTEVYNDDGSGNPGHIIPDVNN